MNYINSLWRPDELVSLIKLKYSLPDTEGNMQSMSMSKRWCYQKLCQTSRSFSVVIQELGEELRDAVAIFYLVLRGLDTIEDDMNYPYDLKSQVLIDFHTYLDQPGYTFSGCGEEHEQELLEHFDKVIDVYLTLNDNYREIIKEITKRMGKGMSDFIHKEIDSVKDWNLYCHYVAGLVGVGLSRMFAVENEDSSFASLDDISNSMGLFLQKTNIIRDFLEDLDDNRVFWPKEIWKTYTSKLDYFREETYQNNARHCLNHLVANALEHVPDCLNYLSKVKDPNNFNFCAIPQVMAIGTLSLCFNNPDVFSGVVKLRRGVSAKIMLNVKNGMSAVYSWFHYFACEIENKIDEDDPNAERLQNLVKKIKDICSPNLEIVRSIGGTEILIGVIVAASSAFLVHQLATKNVV
eukprot:TRINITY_DN995_c0_g3_i1.p1 TRINITY_DN995_c0_g3~~TRINITY_DN995_c0_g3_i1.p1  ORF type:complete len:407 (+),score=127.46 TRINITY_DN995_c0_g3_i1:197-1417(+)